MKISSRVRSSLIGGTIAIALTSALFAIMCCNVDGADTDTLSSEVATTTTTELTTTTTISTTTTSATTTSSETTTAPISTTQIQESVYIEPIVETTVAVEPVIYDAPEVEYVEPSGDLPITERERILLCNVVANEYGADYVSVYDKACVVAVVMNRVNDGRYPNDIESVLVQPYQFSGYWASDSYYSKVTNSCIEAVDYYFAHSDEFGSWTGFWGDGYVNHFY